MVTFTYVIMIYIVSVFILLMMLENNKVDGFYTYISDNRSIKYFNEYYIIFTVYFFYILFILSLIPLLFIKPKYKKGYTCYVNNDKKFKYITISYFYSYKYKQITYYTDSYECVLEEWLTIHVTDKYRNNNIKDILKC